MAEGNNREGGGVQNIFTEYWLRAEQGAMVETDINIRQGFSASGDT